MEKTFAVVLEEKVENIIVWDGESPFEIEGSLVEIPEGLFVDIGFNYIDGVFVDPNLSEGEQEIEQQG